MTAYYCSSKQSPQSQDSKHNRRDTAHCGGITPRRFEFLKHRRPIEPVKALENPHEQTAGTGVQTLVPPSAGKASRTAGISHPCHRQPSTVSQWK
jgi:hypothetical protein